jgi:hypothetical protein
VPASALCIIGDRDALAWVLTERRMAFPAGRASSASRLRVGDRLFLYTTRGCFKNPGRDRGRVIGSALVQTAVERFPVPVEISGRRFDLGCRLDVDGLAPFGAGVPLQPLAERLRVFPDAKTWSAWMRRALLFLPPADADLIASELADVAGPPKPAAIDGYRVAARTPAGAAL